MTKLSILKKLTSSKNAFLLAVVIVTLLITTPTTSFAHDDAIVDSNVIEPNSFYETIVSPLEIPCDYWPDMSHRYQNGITTSEKVFKTTHQHLVSGVWLKCTIYDVYNVLQRYCACGMKQYYRTYQGERHEHL